jgi:hypothetical protein
MEQPPSTPQPPNSFRIILTLARSAPRIDQVLIEALRKQSENILLQNISRTAFKELFNTKRVLIKGQPARPSSSLAHGSTTVDVLGFDQVTDHAR